MKIRVCLGICICMFSIMCFVGCGGKENVPSTENVSGSSSTIVDVPESSETEIVEDTNEYADFAIADVDDYVNIRKEPNTEAEIVGKLYDGSVAQILEVAGENDEWFKIVSGNAEGYIKAEFFIYGEDAVAVIDQYIAKYVEVTCDRLNVRSEASTESARIAYVELEERLLVLEDGEEWIKVKYLNKEGYVSADYVTIVEEFIYAKTIEEERAELAAIAELEARENESEDSSPQDITEPEPPSDSYTTNEELRNAIVAYAKQFVGYPYVHGGQTLSGTDCSGFTMLILKEFGYSISRTPQGQYTGAGRAISYSEAQPGDIICYSDNGSSCTHVAFYIGNGQIVHAANSRDGVKISSATQGRNIIGVRNVID